MLESRATGARSGTSANGASGYEATDVISQSWQSQAVSKHVITMWYENDMTFVTWYDWRSAWKHSTWYSQNTMHNLTFVRVEYVSISIYIYIIAYPQRSTIFWLFCVFLLCWQIAHRQVQWCKYSVCLIWWGLKYGVLRVFTYGS